MATARIAGVVLALLEENEVDGEGHGVVPKGLCGRLDPWSDTQCRFVPC